MAPLATAIADIYEPQIWSQYFIEANTDKNLLVQSGIAAATPEVVEAANKGGRTVYMPFWDDLSHNTGTADGSKVATDTDDEITADGINSGEDIAVKHFRTQSWASATVVKYAAGSDPIRVVLDKYVNWWIREEQRLALLTLTGVFADSAIATALSKDISVETASTDSANLISSEAIEDTRFLLGDAYDKFTAIIMHSVQFKRLRKLDLIDFVPVSDQNPMGGQVPFYMGLRVMVDDTMTVTAGSTSGYKYDAFLFGQGAFARVDIPLESGDPNVEIYRQPTQGKGAGKVSVLTRKYFTLHPRGIAYSGSLSGVISPSDSDLAADNWTQAFLTKNIRIARLRTNG